MDLRSALLGKPKPPPHIAEVKLGETTCRYGFRAPTLADMQAAEKQLDNIGKGVLLLILLTVDPDTQKAVFTMADKDGLMQMEPADFGALTEAMSPVLSAKKPAPSDTGTVAAPSSAG